MLSLSEKWEGDDFDFVWKEAQKAITNSQNIGARRRVLDDTPS
jgi:hypothetical protein